MTIGSKIAHYRKKQNITQEALAQKLGVTNQAVSKWELDQACPDIQLLPLLADIFETTIDELFDRPPKKTPSFVSWELPWENDDTLRVVLYLGHTLLGNTPANEKATFTYEGPALNIKSAVTVCCGDVGGNVDAGANIHCGNICGNADAGANIYCGNVEGSVDAGKDVYCGNVGGDVDAGCNVECSSIGGDADAGKSVVIRK